VSAVRVEEQVEDELPELGPALTLASRLSFPPLSILPEGDDFLVGDPQSGIFLAIPEIGVTALRALDSGQSVGEAAATASLQAGEDVNVLEFAAVLVESGLVRAVDGRPLAAEPAGLPGVGWLARVPAGLVRPFFGRTAWTIYGLLLAFDLAVLVTRPQYRPTFEDIFFYPNPAACILAMIVTSIALAACHEAWHAFAARAVGVAATLRVSRRLFLVVFETDLSQLWAAPRRHRFGPFLAGMAFDATVLAACLGLRLAWAEGLIELPPLLVRFLGAVVLLQVLALGFQLLVFLRTDIYAVLITALGCRNLWRVTNLSLKRRLFRLAPAEVQELASSSARDAQVARWFGLLYLGGLVLAAWFFVTYFYPSTVVLSSWMFHSLSGAPIGSSGFWQALTIGLVAALQALAPLAVLGWEQLRTGRAGAS
jgi:putative peptide zinc metalloprotease protein